MQHVIANILPLKLKSLGAPNLVIGLLLTSAFPVMGMFLSPYLSFKSDYLRTRWGRRIPFIVFSLPFVCLSIVLLAYSGDIARQLSAAGWLPGFSSQTVALIVIGICILFFQLSDVLVSSVYGYIFNDTVPASMIGRFFGLMQIGGGLIGFLFNYFVFPYAESHTKEIFLATALTYLFGMGCICLFVKEGKYPDVTEEDRERTVGWRGVKTYFRESFSHRFYWTKFLYASTPALTLVVVAPFEVFFYRDMGLSLELIGRSAAILSVSYMAAGYFAAVFIDRWHPLRILCYSTIFALLPLSSNWVWLFVKLPPDLFFWLHVLGAGLVGIFNGALTNLSISAFDMRLQPKSRFGQFNSAQWIIRNFCTVLGGIAIGCYYDGLKWIFGGDFAYRFNFVWVGAWYCVAAYLVCCLYRQWRKLGGDLHFRPPAPWSPVGFEEMDQVPFVSTQSRWLGLALTVFRAIMVMSIGYLIPLVAWLGHRGLLSECRWYLSTILPAALLTYFLWAQVEKSIRSDVARCLRGQAPLNGIPHHGVLLLKSVAFLLLFFLTAGQILASISLDMRQAVVLFGVVNVLKNLFLTGAVVILCRVERGFDVMLNFDGRHDLSARKSL